MNTKFGIISCVGLVLALGSGAGCRRAEPAAGRVEAATVVRLVPLELTEASPPVRVPGVLSRKTEVEFAFKIGGVIAALPVRAGDRVERGQLLARLQLDEIDAQLVQAKSAAEKARRDLARVEKLREGRVATLENLQDARTALAVAEAAVRIAEFNRLHAEIVAPAAGRVLRRQAEPGELVGPGRAIVTFASNEEGWLVRVGLAERDAGQVAVGAAARVRFDGDEQVDAAVSRISEANDAATRTTPVEIAVATAPAGARSGSIVAVEIARRPVAARPRVPLAALIEGGGDRAALFVVEGGATTAKRIEVRVEQVDGEWAWLRTVLPAGVGIVASGAEYLRDGAPIAVAK